MIAFALLIAALSAASAAPPSGERPGLKTALDRAGRWVQQFEQRFITVIADEVYDQTVANGVDVPAHRRIRSDLLFMREGARRSWSAVRNVLSYADADGPAHEVPNSADRLTRALEQADGRMMLGRLADESARFNIGHVARNFNTPTFVLQLLDEDNRWRFRFRLDGAETIAGDEAERLSYREREHPTLVKANFRDTELSGRIWVRASDGAVLRTTLALEARPNRGLPAVTTTVDVDYAYDGKLGMMAPSRMDERYVSADENVSGTAVYANYRVFETSARVVSPR
jgi:hypothetical protein